MQLSSGRLRSFEAAAYHAARHTPRDIPVLRSADALQRPSHEQGFLSYAPVSGICFRVAQCFRTRPRDPARAGGVVARAMGRSSLWRAMLSGKYYIGVSLVHVLARAYDCTLDLWRAAGRGRSEGRRWRCLVRCTQEALRTLHNREVSVPRPDLRDILITRLSVV